MNLKKKFSNVFARFVISTSDSVLSTELIIKRKMAAMLIFSSNRRYWPIEEHVNLDKLNKEEKC